MGITYLALGLACLVGSYYLVRHLRPRDGTERKGWLASEFGSMVAGLSVVILFVTGGALVIKGFVG